MSKTKIEILIQGIDLNQEMEQFYGITNQALAVLVQDVEGACDAALQTITKIKLVNFLIILDKHFSIYETII